MRWLLQKNMDIASIIPNEVKKAEHASTAYKLFFVFENYLRDLIKENLSENDTDWWRNKVPKDVQDEVLKSQAAEESKAWMGIGQRDGIFLTTYPQLLRIIEHSWKDFEKIIRDKNLVHEARLISHLRNTACHMVDVPDEELERVKQVIKDWFRMVAP